MSVPWWLSKLYNRISPNTSECRKRNPQAAHIMSSASSSFFHEELGRALAEQSFGLSRYEVSRQHSVHEATALVTLLEGANIKVYLDARGYRLDSGQTYESIEGLLQSASPMYSHERENTIIKKLQALQ